MRSRDEIRERYEVLRSQSRKDCATALEKLVREECALFAASITRAINELQSADRRLDWHTLHAVREVIDNQLSKVTREVTTNG